MSSIQNVPPQGPLAPVMNRPLVPPQGSLAPGMSQPLVIQTMGYPQRRSTCGRVIDNWQAKPVLIMGAIILVIGVLCIAFNIGAMVMHSEIGFVAHGIWCGIVYIIAGAFTVAAGSRRTFCFIVNCMVLSIISAVFAIPVIATSITGLVVEKTNWYFYNYDYQPHSPDPSCCSYDYGFDDYGESSTTPDQSCCRDYSGGYSYDTRTLAAREAMHGLLLILAVAEGILAICVSVCCCKAVACCSNQPRAQASQGGPVNQVGGMQFIVIQGQNGYTQAIPLNTQGMLYNPQPTGPQVQGMYPSGQQQQPMQSIAPPAYSTQLVPQVGNVTPPPAYQTQALPEVEQQVKYA